MVMSAQIKKNIWIIGAGSGIGRALAIDLAKEGHHLALSGRRLEALEKVHSEINPSSRIYPFDISNPSDMNVIYQKIKNEIGPIDSVICMAAQYEPMSLDNLDINKVAQIIDTNLTSSFRLVHVVLPDMKLRRSGQIILCGSVAGYRGLPRAQPYSATKAAIINLAETLRAETMDFGIDIKVICPGFVKTEMTDKNEFDMPMIITAEAASQKIMRQIFNPDIFEVKTHGFFSLIMKALRIIPYFLFFRVVKKIS
jgi:short-subunit dehydrogenase